MTGPVNEAAHAMLAWLELLLREPYQAPSQVQCEIARDRLRAALGVHDTVPLNPEMRDWRGQADHIRDMEDDG